MASQSTLLYSCDHDRCSKTAPAHDEREMPAGWVRVKTTVSRTLENTPAISGDFCSPTHAVEWFSEQVVPDRQVFVDHAVA